jgi:hypothetical protein
MASSRPPFLHSKSLVSFHNALDLQFLFPSLHQGLIQRPPLLRSHRHFDTSHVPSMASKPSSTCAMDGSATAGRCVIVPVVPNHSSSCPISSGSQQKLPSSYPLARLTNPPSSSSSHKPSASTIIEQQNLSASRVGAYATDSAHSHVQHRHSSSQQAIQEHTKATGSYLEAFEATMERSEK